MQNILHDILEFSDVGARRIQDRVCRFGVGQNGAERLVHFVSNCGGQFASHREAVDMRKLCHALPRLHFGETTPTMLRQQDRDKSGLRKNECDNECDLPRIPLPYGYHSEVDLAARWKAALADAPAPHLPPVKRYLIAKDFSKGLRRRRARQEP